MGNYIRENPGLEDVSLPSYVERCFCRVVGAGGGGGSTSNGDSTSAASGGGGGGYASASINILSGGRGSIRILVGSGGNGGTSGSTTGGTGGQSYAGPSGARIIGFGGLGGESSNGTSGGGTSVNGGADTNNVTTSNGEGTVDVRSDTNARAGRGGGAGRPGGNCGGPVLGNPPGDSGIPGCDEHGGSSGDGVNISNGNDRNNGTVAVCGQLGGKNGVISGAGGGGGSRGRDGGDGGPGAAYVSWITFKINNNNVDNGGPNDPVVVYSGQTFQLEWNSPFGGQNLGNQTFTNTGTTSTSENITVTDSQNNRSQIYFDVQPAVRINSLSANPDPQTSGNDGIPNYNTTLSWNLSYGAPGAKSYSIQGGGDTFTGSTGNNGSLSVNNLRQSIVETGLSPRTTPYTLTVSDGFSSDSETVNVQAYNDNTPSNYNVPSPTGLEPSTLTTIQVGPITNIDMVTAVTGSSGVSLSTNNVNFTTGTIFISNNQSFFIRATSPPFNTNPNGLTNTASFSVTVGTVQRFFTLTTRAPDVNETFNLSDKEDYVPYPDIDTIPDPDSDIRNQSNQYIVSDTLLIDDIELGNPYGVEIKVDKPDAQIRVKRSSQSTFGSWQDVRSI